MQYNVFISHSGEDTWVAKQIAMACTQEGSTTFLDEEAIAIGAKFEDEILEALRATNELVVLLTPWALERKYVWMEIGAAWLRQIPIVIVLLGLSAKEIQELSDLPVAIKERNIISLNQIGKYLTGLSERTKTTTSTTT